MYSVISYINSCIQIHISFLVLALFLIFSTTISNAQDPSLVAHWPFDEGGNSTAFDATSNGNDGELFGGPQWVTGVIGPSAVSYDGVDDIMFLADPGAGWNLDLSTSLSISLWIRPSSFQSGSQRKLVSKDNSYEFLLDPGSEGTYGIRLNNNSPISTAADSRLIQGAWQHIAITWDGSNVQYYINGFADGSYAFSDVLTNNNNHVGIGGRPTLGGAQGSIHGALDDVRIYDRALSTLEIQDLFILGAGSDTTAPTRFNGLPTGFLPGGTTDVTLSLVTDEIAICKYDTIADTTYEDMPNTFDMTVDTSHASLITGLEGGTTHRFYIRCQDGVGNTNFEDFFVSFSIRGTGSIGFHPTDLTPLMFYIESTFFNDSINRARSIATCNTQECFDAPDGTSIEMQYCDTVLDGNAIAGARGTAPNGCIRRWDDQSSYISNRADGTELITGRDFGQDDHEKPLFIPNCINGHPCARGLVKKDPPFSQNTTFEIENADGFGNQSVPPTGTPPDEGLNNDFSIFHLVRPIEQDQDWWYFGCSGGRGLRHNIADNSLFYRCGGNSGVPCDNEGLITGPEAVELDQWQLIEIHRDIDDDIQVIINGIDVTSDTPLNAGGGWCYHNVMSTAKGGADGIMEGDLAASAVYDRNLTLNERQNLRDYLDSVYDFLNDRPIIQPNNHSAPRGYQERACGFDMDDDFIYGEPEDDCNVGDGVTTDPDGDGVDEDLIYVDCQNGSDVSGDGSPGTPYLTIGHALDQANGPGGGAEDIIAFTGVCSPSAVTIVKSGVPGIKVRPKSGSEERDFEYASNPIMIIGWDKDNDGEYPPFDTDDVSEVYGGPPNCLVGAFRTGEAIAVSYLEMAHFTVREYGTCEPGNTPSGFMFHKGPKDQIYSHHYFHDLSMIDVNRGTVNGDSGTIVHSLFSGGSLKWAAWENEEILNSSGYSYRGSAGSEIVGDAGPWRFKGTTRTCFANGTGTNSTGTLCTGWKTWRYISQVEVIDQIFDMNINGGWIIDPKVANVFTAVVQCLQDWVIRNNEVRDVKSPFKVSGYDKDACNPESQDGFAARPTKDIVFDGNIWKNTFRWAQTPEANAQGTCLSISGCVSLDSTVSNVKFYNNVCWSNVDMGSHVSISCLQDFGENPGSYEIINNTFYSTGASTLFTVADSDIGDFSENDITFINNIGVLKSRETALRFDFPIDNFVSDNNTYSSDLKFVWNRVNLGFNKEVWYEATGQDFYSFTCTPTFVDPLNADLHLDPSDACAVNFGQDMSRDIATDVDWEVRPSNLFWDIGADELSDGPPLPDTTPPLRSNASPTGSLPSGTTETDISLTTNEAATCKYSMIPGISFDSMTSILSNTGGLAHSSTVLGLMDDQAYTFYVKCEDALGNDNADDLAISFDIDGIISDITPPVRSNGAPVGSLPSGSTDTNISLTTDENAICKYSTTPGVGYDSMTSTFSTTGGTSHSSNITGLTDGNSYTYYIRCQDVSNNSNTDDFSIMFNVDEDVDSIPPVRSNGAPVGSLPSGTTDTNISLTTDENAVCKYSSTAGLDYDSMTSMFSTTGGTSHSSNITGLTDGNSYTYYIRCQDVSNNSNTDDFSIMFNVDEDIDSTPPVRSNAAPTGTLPSGSTDTNISLTTDENAICKYSTTPGVGYDSMTSMFSTTGGTSHSSNVNGLSDGNTYNYYIKCQDEGTNLNTDDYLITFMINSVVDIIPPFRTNGFPSGALASGTTVTNITLTTDENATCKYSTTPGVGYDSMTSTFITTGATSHSSNITGLTDGNSYTYYIRCQDASNNSNTDDFIIVFSVDEDIDSTPPVRSNAAPTGTLPSGITDVDFSISTDENAICKYSTTPGVPYDSMASTFSHTGGTNHGSNVNGLTDGNSYNYYVKCQDENGNSNTDDFLISFSINVMIDNASPARMNGTPTGVLKAGTTEIEVALSTDENAICRYSQSPNITFDSMTSVFTTTGGTFHSSILTGVSDGQDYTYFVRCQDGLGNTNISDYIISFSIGNSPPQTNIMLQSLLPSQAGVENMLMAMNATPNEQVLFIWGFNLQDVSADYICQGLQTGILRPRTNLQAVTADSNGKATLNVSIPSMGAGVRVLIQAIDLFTCTGSEINTEILTAPNLPILHPPVPGTAGTLNTLTASGLTPGGEVKFLWGYVEQTSPADNICQGYKSGILNPRMLTAVTANEFGQVTLNVNIPPRFNGSNVVVEVVDLTTCRGSTVSMESL